MLKNTSYRTIYIFLAAMLALLLVLSAGVGAVHLPPGEIIDIVLNAAGLKQSNVNPIHEGLFLQIRLPRTMMCFVVGAALSVSGAVMQSLFRNPIVEPGLTGTSSGAALGAAFVIVYGKLGIFSDMAFMGDMLMPLAAFAGGLAATFIVYSFSSSFGKVNAASMILAGIAVNAIAAGGTGFLAYIARDPQARSITFWSLGTFSGADWTSALTVLAFSVFCITVLRSYAKELNAFQLGEQEAVYLGINTERLKLKIIIVNTLLVSVATSMVGVIAFVGLLVPHLLRLLKSSDNRYLVTGSALMGAVVMTAVDMFCRIVIAPAEMPIGIITAFIGAPVFLWLLYRNRSVQRKAGFYA